MTARSPRGRLRDVILSLPLLVVLAGCGSSGTAEKSAPTELIIGRDSEAGSAGGEVSFDLTGDLPDFAPLYPGAKVQTQLAKASKDGHKGGLILLVTLDPVEKVASFYDDKARAVGVKPAMFVNEADSAVRIFAKGDGKTGEAEGALIAISRADNGGGTEIMITAGGAKADVKEWEMRDWKPAPRPLPRLQ